MLFTVPKDRIRRIERAALGERRDVRIGKTGVAPGHERGERAAARLREIVHVPGPGLPPQPFDRRAGVDAVADDAVRIGRRFKVADGPVYHLPDFRHGLFGSEAPAETLDRLAVALVVLRHLLRMALGEIRRRIHREVPDEVRAGILRRVLRGKPVKAPEPPLFLARVPFVVHVVHRDRRERNVADAHAFVGARIRLLQASPEQRERTPVEEHARCAVAHPHLRRDRLRKAIGRVAGGRRRRNARGVEMLHLDRRPVWLIRRRAHAAAWGRKREQKCQPCAGA